MIIVRSPLRITLGGGGTDLASYYREHGGFLIAAAIDKYVYVTVIRPFTPGVYLKYSKIEHVETVDDVQHPIIRESLKDFRSAHRKSRLRRLRIFRPALGWARPAASRPRCCAHCTLTREASFIRGNSPNRLAASRSTGSASRSASKINISPHSAGLLA